MNISFQSVSIVAKVISTLVISLQALSGVIGLIAIQFLGFIVNTVSVFELKKIPCRATVEVARGRNLRTIFMEAMRKKQERIVLLIVWINVSMFVFIGLIIPFLRKEFGLSNSLVMFYSVLTGIAMVLASMYAKAVGDRLGSRPFLIIGHAAMLRLPGQLDAHPDIGLLRDRLPARVRFQLLPLLQQPLHQPTAAAPDPRG